MTTEDLKKINDGDVYLHDEAICTRCGNNLVDSDEGERFCSYCCQVGDESPQYQQV
jgi:hypothetical protein